MHNKTLNQYYFIKKFEKSYIDKQDKKTIIIFRNYDETIDEKLILTIKNYCKKTQNKFLISNDIKLAIKLNLDGVYIPSFNKDTKHLSYSFKKNFIILGSAHSIYEMRIKELQHVNAIVLSSIFKKNKNYLGLYRFKTLKNLTKKNVIALGGLTKNNKNQMKLVNCNSFAGITYFK